MSNHIHLLVSSKNGDLSEILRDFKKFTSKQIITAIKNNPHESRKEWMLELFAKAGQENSRNKSFQFWRQDNRPMECYSDWFTVQKLDYIHRNPVNEGIVDKPEDYVYSSARCYGTDERNSLLVIQKV